MANVIPIHFKTHENSSGLLCVYEEATQVPFDIKRVFTVSAKKGAARGAHAHKECAQLLVCVSGKIRVTCDDGSVKKNYDLDNMGYGLLIPPGIWSEQEYLTDEAVLMVLCDRVYEADDYLRNYQDFITFIK